MDPDPTFHSDADPEPDPSFQIKAQIHEKLAHLGSHVDPDPVPDPANHFDADPDADPDFYLIRIRIFI